MVLDLGGLRDSVLRELSGTVTEIRPEPISSIVFWSFATQTGDVDSDIDMLDVNESAVIQKLRGDGVRDRYSWRRGL